MRQKLLWVPAMESNGGFGHKRCVLPMDGETVRPFRVWTLYGHTDEASPPSLPFSPVHLTNAFLEDRIHDWNIMPDGRLRYYSRVSTGQVWLLLEWKDSE